MFRFAHANCGFESLKSTCSTFELSVYPLQNESHPSNVKCVLQVMITKIGPLCPTSHKEVGQFYSPAASDIASQWYSAHAEWYLLRKFLEANKISLKPQGFNITIAVAIISLRRSRNITLAFSADSCYNE